MENDAFFLNVRVNKMHTTLEFLIKKMDGAQDMSRAGLLRRAVMAAEPVEDWLPTYNVLSALKPADDAPDFTSWQAQYDAETAERLDHIRGRMISTLTEAGIIKRRLQTQFMLQLLLANYLEYLKKSRLSLGSDKDPGVCDDVDIPTMASIFTELILTDPESEALKDIRKILVSWRQKNYD